MATVEELLVELKIDPNSVRKLVADFAKIKKVIGRPIPINIGVQGGTAAAFSGIEKGAEDAKEKIEEIKDSIDDVQAKVEEPINLRIQSNAREIRTGLDRAFRGATVSVQRFANRAKRQLAGIGTELRAVRNGLLAIGAAGTVGLVQGLRSAFEESTNLANANVILKLSQEDLSAANENLRKTANDLGISFGEVSEALFDVASAGFQGQAAFDVVTTAAKLATANAIPISVAFNAIATAMSNFGVSADEASDKLTQIGQFTRGTVADVSKAIALVGPLAATVGIDFDTLGGAFASLTAKGIPAEQAITGLRQIITGLIKPSDQAKEAFDKLGITTGDNAFRLRSFAEILTLVRDRVSDVDIGDLFPGEAISNVAALTSDIGLLTSNIENLGDVAGATEAALVKSLEGPGKQFTQFINLVNNAITSIGSTVAGVAGPVLKFVNDFIKRNQALVVILAGTTIAVALLAGALGAMFLLLGPIGSAFTVLNGLLGVLGIAAISATTALAGLAAALGVVAVAIGGLLVGTGIDALIDGFIELGPSIGKGATEANRDLQILKTQIIDFIPIVGILAEAFGVSGAQSAEIVAGAREELEKLRKASVEGSEEFEEAFEKANKLTGQSREEFARATKETERYKRAIELVVQATELGSKETKELQELLKEFPQLANDIEAAQRIIDRSVQADIQGRIDQADATKDLIKAEEDVIKEIFALREGATSAAIAQARAASNERNNILEQGLQRQLESIKRNGQLRREAEEDILDPNIRREALAQITAAEEAAQQRIAEIQQRQIENNKLLTDSVQRELDKRSQAIRDAAQKEIEEAKKVTDQIISDANRRSNEIISELKREENARKKGRDRIIAFQQSLEDAEVQRSSRTAGTIRDIRRTTEELIRQAKTTEDIQKARELGQLAISRAVAQSSELKNTEDVLKRQQILQAVRAESAASLQALNNTVAQQNQLIARDQARINVLSSEQQIIEANKAVAKAKENQEQARLNALKEQENTRSEKANELLREADNLRDQIARKLINEVRANEKIAEFELAARELRGEGGAELAAVAVEPSAEQAVAEGALARADLELKAAIATVDLLKLSFEGVATQARVFIDEQTGEGERIALAIQEALTRTVNAVEPVAIAFQQSVEAAEGELATVAESFEDLGNAQEELGESITQFSQSVNDQLDEIAATLRRNSRELDNNTQQISTLNGDRDRKSDLDAGGNQVD